ncbi:hypothetical protein DE146DRAFT_791052 [Phaeosphaeria sp. MPI-PUGE-AT-0046c]|nr:hypothetical protein DE146DRAFT_791052 [Phaeosphaeria sp. MPI-PUGE-AT-0046c]
MNIPMRLRGGPPPPLPPRKPSDLQQQQQQQQSSSIVHGSRQAKYNCSCGPTNKVECSCTTCHSILRDDNSPCSYFGRCVEPLAWNIEHELVRTQNQCSLFTLLPKEIRELVFEFALIDGKGQSLDSLIKRNVSRLSIRIPNQNATNDIAINLLRTCRAVYMETWTLPLSLNPYIVYDLHPPAKMGMKLHELLPWQFALISSLDITLQQAALEGPTLQKYLHRNKTWRPIERHNGAYMVRRGPLRRERCLAPRRFKTLRGPRAMTEYPESFNFCLIPTSTAYKDTTTSTEPRHFLSYLLGHRVRPALDLAPPWPSAMRVMLASPLTHLTLRIQHSDWWTWTDDPSSSEAMHLLGLDPSVGDGRAHPLVRPTAPRMRALAEARRAGNHPEVVPDVGWGYAMSQMRDLRSLELVLETFAAKKRQLEEVVEASKTWVFPMAETRCELAWDGEVGVSSWSMKGLGKEDAQGPWHKNAHEFEVRNVRFVRRRVAG